ncbi:Bromodomain-containing protein 8 [Podila minutissima]|nr:Bromodomain-containing protein 8 [Podila minutissima]
MSDPTSTEIKSDNEPWSILENLILAQAIYKCGDTNWVAIARTIKLHPQIHRTSNFFTQKSCAIQYTQLLENLEAETRRSKARSTESSGSSATTQDHSPVVKLAGQLYNQRILEIKAEIRKDEERFRALIAELDEIRQGKWDAQLEEQLKQDHPEGLEDAQQGQGSSDTTKEPGKPDEADSTMADTAPSSLSSPGSSALSDKQEDSGREANLVSEPQSEKSSGSEVEPTDVEMEDVQDNPATPKAKDAAESADVEMEDATGESPHVASEDSTPAVPREDEPFPDSLGQKDHGSASSGMSPAPESEASRDPEDAISRDSPEKPSIETPKDEIDEDVKDEDETEDHPPQSKQQKRESKSSPEAEVIKEEEATDIKADEIEDEGEGEEGGSSEEEDEEDEEDQSKGGRKPPKKIKTSVIPNKRKRRGRGGDAEEGYNSSDSETTDSANTNLSSSDHLLRTQMDDKKWKKILMMIWTDIANHRFGAVFMQPIKEQDAPGYYLMIKRPMDLKSIKERIRDGQITNADEFHRDVLLMFMNALMYNGEDTEVYQMALAMMTEVEFIIKNFKSSQSFAPAPSSSNAAGGSGNTSISTTPTTRSAPESAISTAGTSSSSRRRKSSGLDAE